MTQLTSWRWRFPTTTGEPPPLKRGQARSSSEPYQKAGSRIVGSPMYDEAKALRGLTDRKDRWSVMVHARTATRITGNLYYDGAIYRADFNVEIDKEGRFSVSLHRVKNSQVRFKLGEYVIPLKPPEPSAAR